MMRASQRLEFVRWLALSAVAGVIGGAAVWCTIAGVRSVFEYGASLEGASAQSLAALFGPGVFGTVLLVSLVLILARRRVGEPIYWGALVLGAAVLLLSRFGSLGLIRLPDGRGRSVSTTLRHRRRVISEQPWRSPVGATAG